MPGGCEGDVGGWATLGGRNFGTPGTVVGRVVSEVVPLVVSPVVPPVVPPLVVPPLVVPSVFDVFSGSL